MPQANRALASFGRRPAIRAATLLWLWLAVLLAPAGATWHAMSHMESAGAAGPKGDDPDRHGAAAHCHACDEWQFLDHVLPNPAQADAAPSPAIPVATRLPVSHLAAGRPWILPRAPPRRLNVNT